MLSEKYKLPSCFIAAEQFIRHNKLSSTIGYSAIAGGLGLVPVFAPLALASSYAISCIPSSTFTTTKRSIHLNLDQFDSNKYGHWEVGSCTTVHEDVCPLKYRLSEGRGRSENYI